MSDRQMIDLSGTNGDIARWIWKNLVPDSGQADSVQGEILRVIQRLRWEAQDNGNINWDDRWLMFIDFLESTLGNEKSFTRDIKASIHADLERLRHFTFPDEVEDWSQPPDDLPYIENDLYNRLLDHLVSYCRKHPHVIPHKHDPKQYR